MGACVEINCSGRGWSTDERVSLDSGVVKGGWRQGQGCSTGRVGTSAGKGVVKRPEMVEESQPHAYSSQVL